MDKEEEAKTDISTVYTSVSQPPDPGVNYTGPSSYKKRIYRAAASHRLRTIGV
jgi:hypothetical protein